MSGYRFCRTDDIGLLVDAYNHCCAGCCENEPPMTVEGFKKAARELNVWASSCMLAFAGPEPIGVLWSAKRDRESLIYRIGVRREHRRQGHGRHLLTSLRQKLAILGPPRLIAEISTRCEEACRFLESCDYHPEARFVDFSRNASARGGDARGAAHRTAEGGGELAAPITIGDLMKSGAFDESVERSWGRSLATLVNRRGELRGLAVASDLRIEAHLFHRRNEHSGAREIVALGFAPGDEGEALLAVLVRRLLTEEDGEVVVPQISEKEIRFSLLESWGFRRGEEYVRFAATAAPR